MTFCCRPSQSCFRCRQRRIKCDRVRPACSQCKRASKQCAGYREELSLLFRDENERTIRRAKAAKERSRAKEQAIVRRPYSPGTLTEDSTLSEATTLSKLNIISVLSRPMLMTSLDIDSHALQFFIHHFSTVPWFHGSFPPAQHRNMIQDLDIDPSFRSSVVSIGLAAMSNVHRDRTLLGLARQRYGTALSEVRKAVGNPSCGNVGSLLRMILMLALFEMVDAKPETLHSCTTHITGVSALLKKFPSTRGREFNAQAELWFYFAVIVNYFQVGGPFPAELNNWSAPRMASNTGETWPAFELIEILIKFVRLCAALPYHQATEVELLREVVGLEFELQSWMDCLPAQWSFVVEETADVPGTFYGQYHIYQNVWASRVLNNYHVSRLLVNEVILAFISKIDEPTVEWIEQKERSLGVVTQMATDICVGIATQDLFRERNSLLSQHQPRPLLRGIFMTIYPLTAAASATTVPDQLRNWVIQTLQKIGDQMGIREALEAIPRIQLAVANEMQLAMSVTCG
ncbi:hypothetical protein BDW59DRAFT_106761 [Aspergillus cavernicola]|uniref:Zn(2)-C6 fungal-type domain-containing protein n=1 Tax=Aspergillus cavernicola TaxID=176166 RepID=A0ABR4I3E5_9EURO